MANSTAKQRRKKPAKPYPDFPLFAHATFRWAKKIKGKLHYFGPWEDPDGALRKYLDERDDLHAGRVLRRRADGLPVRDLLNRFLTAKRRLLDQSEIVHRTFKGHHRICVRINDQFGPNYPVEDLTNDDFAALRAELAKSLGPLALGVALQQVRTVFKFAYEAGLVKQPIRFGAEFKGPSQKRLRMVRHANGPKMFERDELHTILRAVTIPLRAMTLLGINFGLGNHDCGALPITAVDRDSGWITYPREKTGTLRRCPLWPETIGAIEAVLETRPKPKTPAAEQLLFVTGRGNPWVRTNSNGVWVDSVSFEFRKWLTKLGIKRPGVAFYALRHTFRTVADETRDQPAIDFLMGHAPDSNDMAAVYRERIGDDRLRAVVDHVRVWLFGETIE